MTGRDRTGGIDVASAALSRTATFRVRFEGSCTCRGSDGQQQNGGLEVEKMILSSGDQPVDPVDATAAPQRWTPQQNIYAATKNGSRWDLRVSWLLLVATEDGNGNDDDDDDVRVVDDRVNAVFIHSAVRQQEQWSCKREEKSCGSPRKLSHIRMRLTYTSSRSSDGDDSTSLVGSERSPACLQVG